MGDEGDAIVATDAAATKKASFGGGGFKKRGANARANARKRAAASSSDDDDGGGGGGGGGFDGDEDEQNVGRKKRSQGIVASSRDGKGKYERFAFEGSKTVRARGDMGATAELEIDTSKEMDGRAMREQVLKQAIDRADGFEDDKKYRGTNAYVDYRAGVPSRADDFEREGPRGARSDASGDEYSVDFRHGLQTRHLQRLQANRFLWMGRRVQVFTR